MAMETLAQTPRRGTDGRYHFTYVTYDIDTLEWYGGKHTTNNLKDGYRGSGEWVVNHLMPERLVTEPIEFFDSEQAAYTGEAIWLVFELIDNDPLCRNLGEGGAGVTSEALRRRWAQPGAREEQSATMIAALASPEARLRMSVAAQAALNRPEVRALISEITTLRLADPDVKARHRAGLKKAWSDPVVKARRVAATVAALRRPEVRKKISENTKAARAKPDVHARYLAGMAQPERLAKLRDMWADLEIRAKHLKGLNAAYADPALRAKVSAMTKVAMARPEVKAKQKAGLARPEVKARLAEVSAARWSQPGAGARHSAAMKAACCKGDPHGRDDCGARTAPGNRSLSSADRQQHAVADLPRALRCAPARQLAFARSTLGGVLTKVYFLDTRPGWRIAEMAVRSIAGSIFVLAVVATSSASAEDAIKSGNWEYSVTDPRVTQLPRGVQPSPDMRLGPEGLTLTRTRCTTAADPFPPLHDGDVYKVDKKEVTGGTLRWPVTCVIPKPKGTVNADWVMHYHGETMDGEVTFRSTTADYPTPVERRQQLNGRYLGPCPDK